MTAAASSTTPPTPPERAVRGLYSSAQRFAQEAAAHLAERRYDDSMAKAGIALEQMVKAFLVNEHPLLIVASPGGQLNLDGMRWALRNQPHVAAKSRTITATEAVRRCCNLVPGLDERSLKVALDARSGALHIGQSGADADSVIAAVAMAADLILPEIGQDSRGLWGHYYDAVMGRLDEKQDQIAHAVADRMARAKDNWEITFKRLGVEGTNALRAAAGKYSLTDARPARQRRSVLHPRDVGGEGDEH